jgi:sugar lactone lactonase YvrE
MKKLFFLTMLIVSITSCSKEENLGPHLFPGKLPGKWGGKIASDSKGRLWFTTSEIDSTIKLPAYSSSIPIRIYLTKHYNDSYEVYDTKFIGARDIITDKFDRLWFISGDKVYLLKNNKYVVQYKIGGETGSFEWITTDKQSDIWVGGWKAPLLKITLDPEIKINVLSNNSSAANTSAGCFDNNNNLWVILTNSQIGMRDNQGRWTVYTPDNSQLPYQSFWSITADKDNNIWAGTGFTDSGTDLMKFDGTKWESVTIRDDKGNAVYGTVRQLYSYDNKIWIVPELTVAGAFESNYLITFDGITWNRIYDVPQDDGITDVAFDTFGNRVLIGTMNKGIFEVSMD